MLFNSYLFIFLFLPVCLAGYHLLGRVATRQVALTWLVACSLVHYGWWQPTNVLLLSASLLFNYSVGAYLGRHVGRGRGLCVLTLGVAANLALLGYYKYTNFFVNQLNAVAHAGWHIREIVLPLGISFYTFQQVAYLVDAHRGQAREYNFVDYCLFVTYFPQLIAGPIVHHAEMLPQFTRHGAYRINIPDLSVGASMFFLGLAKKVIIADNVALYVSPVFNAAGHGVAPGCADAWIAALAYTFQLYFDFSGYSDMALGLGRLFGIKLPINFNSPYKAVNLTEFWKRWHMTLSRFLRDYLYIPLGGSRRGPVRRYVNLMLTMLLGGLWHGAGWNFVFWGGLPGLGLVLHQAWRTLREKLGHPASAGTPLGRFVARAVTFFVVVIAWVFFRAANFSTALLMLRAMFLPHTVATAPPAIAPVWLAGLLLAGLLAAVWYLPNTPELFAAYKPTFESETAPQSLLPHRLHWQPRPLWAVGFIVLAAASFLLMSRISEFIYWQF